MNKKLLVFLILFLVCLGQAVAEADELEFALFKRTVSPVMKWGENGVLTIPKATTVGRTNIYFGLLGQEAGILNNRTIYLTSATVMAGSSEDVEIGYTRRQIITDDFYFIDFAMDTFHLKARILDFGDNTILPSVAVGMNGVSMVDNAFNNTKDILFNPYIVATSTVKVIDRFLEFSFTALAETIMTDGEFGDPQFSIGADVNLMNFLFAFGELQGFNPEEPNREVINIGAKVRLGWITAGLGMFNIIRDTEDDSGNLMDNYTSSTFDLENANYIGSVVVTVPLGKLFLGIN